MHRGSSIAAHRPTTPGGLLRAAHPGPALAVTLLAGAYAVSVPLSAPRAAIVVAAVLAGQLSIGWCNDLVDRHRDRAVGRTDKPLATGELSARVTAVACATALAATVVLSLAAGPVAGAAHLVVVAAGWAYDLGLKSTVWSWVPYAVAFGTLPVFVDLAGPGSPPPAWVPLAGALLGIGAHLVNVLPDLEDDAATGVRGLGHRLGARRSARLAVGSLAAATLTVALGAGEVALAARLLALLAAGALGVVALLGQGRAPFRAAVGIAAVDVVLLVAAR